MAADLVYQAKQIIIDCMFLSCHVHVSESIDTL